MKRTLVISILAIIILSIAVCADSNLTYITNINDTSTTVYGYSDGTLNNVFYNETAKGLMLSGDSLTGTFTSQVFSAGTIVDWKNISWDSVLGMGAYADEDSTPTMTSDTTPSGECSANVFYSEDTRAYKAFDDANVVEGWIGWDAAGDDWIKYDFEAGNEKVINKYSVQVAVAYVTLGDKESAKKVLGG